MKLEKWICISRETNAPSEFPKLWPPYMLQIPFFFLSTCLLHCLLLTKSFYPVSYTSWKAKGNGLNRHRFCFSYQKKEECRVETDHLLVFWEKNKMDASKGEEAAFPCRKAALPPLARSGWQCPHNKHVDAEM